MTRKSVLNIVEKLGLIFVERAFSLDEAQDSKEAFLTSSTALVKPVVEIDGKKIGEGSTGPLTKQLIKNYFQYVENSHEPH